MPHRPVIPSLWLLTAPLLLALACSHDSPRDNPLDPTLTPPVELQVTLDDTAGTATLTWTRYGGEAEFGEYWVLRNISESTRVDTLGEIRDQQQTTYKDTSLEPDTGYVYRVSVVNPEGFEQPSDEQRTDGYVTRLVQLLQPESAPETGAINLAWTKYRDPGFGSYEIHRRAVGTDQDSVLSTIPNVEDTTFADTTPLHEVNYLYNVVVAAAGQELPSNSREGRLELPPVEISGADLDSRTATATLEWTLYAGPRLRGYRVRRSTPGEGLLPIAILDGRTETSFVDTELVGNTPYTYEVVAVTDRGEDVVSSPVTGIFHELVDTWPLDVSEGSCGTDYVRLYAEENDRITVLITGCYDMRLQLLDTSGREASPAISVELLPFRVREHGSSWAHLFLEPRTGSKVRGANGDRLFTIGDLHTMGVFALDSSGDFAHDEVQPFADVFAQALTGDRGVVLGEAGLAGHRMGAAYSDVLITASDGTILLADGFDSGFEDPGKWFRDGPWRFPLGWAVGDSDPEGGDAGSVIVADTSWHDFRFEAGVVPTGLGEATAGIHIGGREFSRFALTLDARRQQAELDWYFTSTADTESDSAHFTAPIPGLSCIPSRLALGVVDGQLTASVRTPVRWSVSPGQRFWGSLAMLDDTPIFTARDRGHAGLGADVGDTGGEGIGAAVAETRAWMVEGETAPRAAVCLPEVDQVRFGVVFRSSLWVELLKHNLGPHLGSNKVGLHYPISMDAGSDGRMYVLDSGNSRIVAFDADGRYVTHWGEAGDGVGEFDFGPGVQLAGRVRNYAGSICVDDEGYIYVADVFNKRIQKFAP